MTALAIPETRQETTGAASEQVLVGIASIPEREHSLERVVGALAPQADRIHVSLNGYQQVPSFLDEHDHVSATVRNGDNGGDAEKFAMVDDWDGYVVTCDDDILYPPDYIQTLLAGIGRHGQRTAVSFHGGVTRGWNGSRKAATHKSIRCLGSLPEDDPDVNVLGTGTLAYHADHVPVWRDLFRHPNMADVHFAAHARNMGFAMVALAHEEGWLQDISPGPGIYESAARTASQRKRVLGRHDWTKPVHVPRVRVSVATCDRPHKLMCLLRDLDRAALAVDLDVAVYHDPTDANYREPVRFCFDRGWRFVRMPRRYGRVDHWRLVDHELRDAQQSDADWFLFLPDDVRLVRHAIPRAIDTWHRLDDPATLTLWRLKNLEGATNWTGKRPVDREAAAEIFHVDGLYLCQRKTLDLFGWRCPRPGRCSPSGSGVGRRMSMILDAAGARMYRVNRSLAVSNDDGVSVMNPLEPSRRQFRGVTI